MAIAAKDWRCAEPAASNGFSGWLYSICIVWIHGKAQSHVNFNLIFGVKWHPACGEQRFGGRTVKERVAEQAA